MRGTPPANDRFAIFLLFQILDKEINPEDFIEQGRFHNIILDLSFHIFTSNYNPEIASVLFSALIENGSPVYEEDNLSLGI